ncbi:hypothetical protein NTG1052_370015 [Candidatus Nitrotoga sp. 1052]|nr:hypothetical protein NTG1052_370015 [Candidatus Nitrotoga sp. 1052]
MLWNIWIAFTALAPGTQKTIPIFASICFTNDADLLHDQVTLLISLVRGGCEVRGKAV